MGKKSRSESGMSIPDHISENLEIIFCVKNTYILLCGSGSGIRNLFDPKSGIRDGKIRIPDKHPGSATLALRHLFLLWGEDGSIREEPSQYLEAGSDRSSSL
jgi:hypothetical protein